AATSTATTYLRTSPAPAAWECCSTLEFIGSLVACGAGWRRCRGWHARRDSNPQPAVLETAALPIELLAYRFGFLQAAPGLPGNCFSLKRAWRAVHRSPSCRSRGAPRGRRAGPCLLDDLGHHAGADGAAALADGEAQALVHGDRRDQRHHHLDVVARHDHLHALRQLAGAGHVRGPEVELRAVTLEERSVAATLLLRQHVHLRLELRVRRDRTRLRQHLAALHLVTLGAAQQHAHVVA